MAFLFGSFDVKWVVREAVGGKNDHGETIQCELLPVLNPEVCSSILQLFDTSDGIERAK